MSVDNESLLDAISKGNIPQLEKILQLSSDRASILSQPIKVLNSIQFCLLRTSNAEVFQYLLDNGARADIIQEYKRSNTGYKVRDPLNSMIEYPHLIKQMLEQGASPNVGTIPSSTKIANPRKIMSFCNPLVFAIINKATKTIELLLSQNLNRQYLYTSLYFSVAYNYYTALSLVYDKFSKDHSLTPFELQNCWKEYDNSVSSDIHSWLQKETITILEISRKNMFHNFVPMLTWPRDLITMILQYLSTKDILSVSIVCKTWMLHCKESVILHLDAPSGIAAVVLQEKFPLVKSAIINGGHLTAIPNWLSRLNSLKCSLITEFVTQQCPQVTALELSVLKDVKIKHIHEIFPNLRNLKISKKSGMIGEIFSWPNLETLSICMQFEYEANIENNQIEIKSNKLKSLKILPTHTSHTVSAIHITAPQLTSLESLASTCKITSDFLQNCTLKSFAIKRSWFTAWETQVCLNYVEDLYYNEIYTNRPPIWSKLPLLKRCTVLGSNLQPPNPVFSQLEYLTCSFSAFPSFTDVSQFQLTTLILTDPAPLRSLNLLSLLSQLPLLSKLTMECAEYLNVVKPPQISLLTSHSLKTLILLNMCLTYDAIECHNLETLVIKRNQRYEPLSPVKLNVKNLLWYDLQHVILEKNNAKPFQFIKEKIPSPVE